MLSLLLFWPFRDALRQSQINIEKEYEDKIRDVLEQLKKEEQDKAALQQELERLREEKINASLRYTICHYCLIDDNDNATLWFLFPTFVCRLSDPFIASTPLSVSAPPERFLLPTIPSPTPSESDGSLSFDPTSEREVTGEEHRTSSPLAIKEDYPHFEKKRRNTISCGSIDINLVWHVLRLLYVHVLEIDRAVYRHYTIRISIVLFIML